MKGDGLELIITFFVEVRFGCCLGCISSIFIMKNDYTKFQHLELSIEKPHGMLRSISIIIYDTLHTILSFCFDNLLYCYCISWPLILLSASQLSRYSSS